MKANIARLLSMTSLACAAGLVACAPTGGRTTAAHSLSPRLRSEQNQREASDTSGVTETQPTTTNPPPANPPASNPPANSPPANQPAANPPAQTPAAKTPAAPAKDDKAAVTVEPKCRLTDNSALPSDQATAQDFCSAIAVTPSEGGEITLPGLSLQDNVAAPVDLTNAQQASGPSDTSGQKTFTFVSDSTSPKTKDGKNVLQLGFALPDPAAQIDGLTVTVSSDGSCLKVALETPDNRNDSGLTYVLGQSKNSGQAVINLLMGALAKADPSVVGASSTNSEIPNIKFVVSISYTLKAAATAADPAKKMGPP